MNILEMSVAASVLIVAIVIIRAVGLYRLPKKMFLCLWGIATLRLLFPFSIPLPSSVPVEWAAPVSDLAVNPGAYIPLDAIASPDGPEATIPIALIVWLAGICACAVFFSISYFKSRKEFKTSLPVESEFIDRWLKDHPLRRSIQVRQTDRTKAPLTYGILHPVILLPKRIDLTDESSLRYVLAHEYVHIRHFDALTKLVLTVAACCHWFNPLVWVMYILANRDIELICDETVVKSYEPEGKSSYALTLIKLEEIKSRVAIVNYFSKNFVEERVIAIMKAKRYTLSIMIVALSLVIGATAVFAISTSASSEDGASSVEESKREPIRMIGSFQGVYSDDYELIDELEFSLSQDTPFAVYEGTSDKEIVFAIEDSDPVTCLVTIENGGVSNTYKCGMSGEGGIAIELTPGSSYKVEYQLGIKPWSDPSEFTGETVDESSGTIKVYEIK